MKWIKAVIWCFLIQVFIVSTSTAQTDLVIPDSIPQISYYHYQRDTDSVAYVLIDSSSIVQTDTIYKLVMSRYHMGSYNFTDSTQRPDARKYVNRNLIKVRKTEGHWMIFTLLSIILLYTIIRNVYDKTLVVIFQAYWNDRAINQFTRDDNFLKLRNTLLYFILFTTVYGLLLKFIFNFFEVNITYKGIEEYMIICLFTGTFYLAKFLLMKISGFIFSIQKLISGYLSILSISNFVYAIIVMPMLIFYQFIPSSYQPYLLGLILILFCFNTIYKYLRTGSFILNNFQFPKFYLFLYLCTLEIMPLLIIYKVFIA
ncbi:MAG: DUF4271 domain-containing protein [Sphingobacteriales bacterium]|nr:DUF4271 domain-containing protein [Sphingobacteriales bacterium]